jgi:putative redox protein
VLLPLPNGGELQLSWSRILLPSGWPLQGASARIEKTMTPEAPRRIALLEVWISLPAGLSEEQRAVLHRAGESCPVKLSLEGAVPKRLHWA